MTTGWQRWRRWFVLTLATGTVAGCAWTQSDRLPSPAILSPQAPAWGEPDHGLWSENVELLSPPESESSSSPAASFLEPRLEEGKVAVSLDEAIGLALMNNRVLRVIDGDRVLASRSSAYDIEAAEARERQALAAFDATFEAQIFARDLKRPPNAIFGPGLAQPQKRDEAGVSFGARMPWVTGGSASVNYNPDTGYFFINNPTGSGFNPLRSSSVEISMQQPLMRGAGRAFNQIPIRIAQVGVEQSTWEFKRTALESVRSVISAYWDLYAVRREWEATKELIPLFEEIVRLQTAAREAGWGVQGDVAKATAQLSEFRQQRLDLEAQIVDREYQLRTLMGVPVHVDWKILPSTPPICEPLDTSPDRLLDIAVFSQPDIVRQRLNLRIRQLELAARRNGRQPDLNINALYRVNGNGESLGEALDMLATVDFYDWEFGATYSVPIGLRAAQAQVQEAERKLLEDRELLQQDVFSIHQQLSNLSKQIDYLYQQHREAELRLQAADEWVQGAQLRYKNPTSESGGVNWLLENMNDYLDALRFKASTVADLSELIADYHIARARLDELTGTLLERMGVDFVGDPCDQALYLPPPAISAERFLYPEEMRRVPISPVENGKLPVVVDEPGQRVPESRLDRNDFERPPETSRSTGLKPPSLEPARLPTIPLSETSNAPTASTWQTPPQRVPTRPVPTRQTAIPVGGEDSIGFPDKGSFPVRPFAEPMRYAPERPSGWVPPNGTPPSNPFDSPSVFLGRGR